MIEEGEDGPSDESPEVVEEEPFVETKKEVSLDEVLAVSNGLTLDVPFNYGYEGYDALKNVGRSYYSNDVSEANKYVPVAFSPWVRSRMTESVVDQLNSRGIPIDFVMSIGMPESGLIPIKSNNSGACGPWQVMPFNVSTGVLLNWGIIQSRMN